jgi:4-alpha-glucanotransferase
MGVFAPLSYWKSKDDWGIGDMDVLLKVVEFAKKERISILSMLPLNFPTHDNCPYANVSAYISDPVYIGMNMISNIVGFESPEAAEIIASVIEEIWKLRKNKLSLNEQIRKLKYEVLKAVFKQFDADKHPSFKKYCLSNSWLEEHILFFILARQFKTYDFRSWYKDVALRSPKVIQQLKQHYKEEIRFEAFLQWILTEQIKLVRAKANEGEFPVDLMLDQPFAFGNADVWCNPEAFIFDPKTQTREYTQGAPPHRLDIPQHWQFYLLNTENPASKRLLVERLSFLLQFCDLLRIDHLLGYYRLYYLSEDSKWQMTLENLGIWEDISAIYDISASAKEKREQIYEIIVKAVRDKFPKDAVSEMFDDTGALKHAHVILAARKSSTPDYKDNPAQCGWYSQYSIEHQQELLYTLLNPNEIGSTDYLEKIIEERKMFLAPTDSIRVGFFKAGFGEEIIYLFMKIAQEQGKTLIFENLGVVPPEIVKSLRELGAAEFKPLIFGYQKFVEDYYNPYWFDCINSDSFACFSTQDTVTIRGWWEGRESWAKQKYYFKKDKQKLDVIGWLFEQKYLADDAEVDFRILTPDMLLAVLNSVVSSRAGEAVITMPDIFGSGDDGIINMPGHSGFWTARSPITIEELLDSPPELLTFLARQNQRDSFQKQVQDLNPEYPHILATHPLMGEGAKQLRIMGEEFLIDVVVYGRCGQVSIVFENGRQENMLPIKTGHLNGLTVFRARIPADERMVGASAFRIMLNGVLQPQPGYLIGCVPGTDMNPLSPNYGRSKAQSALGKKTASLTL